MLCPRCGQSAGSRDKFCPACGAKLFEDLTPATPSSFFLWLFALAPAVSAALAPHAAVALETDPETVFLAAFLGLSVLLAVFDKGVVRRAGARTTSWLLAIVPPLYLCLRLRKTTRKYFVFVLHVVVLAVVLAYRTQWFSEILTENAFI